MRQSGTGTTGNRRMAARIWTLVAVSSPAVGILVALPVRADYATDCASPTQTYPDAGGMPTNLNLTSADVVLFASVTFTGSVNSSLARICVASGAQFNPSSLNGASRLFVRGSAVLPPLAAGAGAVLDNEGTVTFQPVPNANGEADVINRPGATIFVLGPGLSLGSGVTVTNDGTIQVAGGVNLNGSTVINNATLTVGGAFNLSGSVTNTGHMTVSGQFIVNGNGTLSNTCSLTAVGLINNNNVANQGVIDLGSSAFTNNSGIGYNQGQDAITIGGDFTNSGSVSGTGQYLFSGITRTQGTMVGDGAGDPIVFYDTTPTGSQVLDFELGTIQFVVREVVTAPAPGACSTSPTTSTTTTSTTTTSTTTTTMPTTTTTGPDTTTTTTSDTTTTTAPPTTTTTLPQTTTTEVPVTTTTLPVTTTTVPSTTTTTGDSTTTTTGGSTTTTGASTTTIPASSTTVDPGSTTTTDPGSTSTSTTATTEPGGPTTSVTTPPTTDSDVSDAGVAGEGAEGLPVTGAPSSATLTIVAVLLLFVGATVTSLARYLRFRGD